MNAVSFGLSGLTSSFGALIFDYLTLWRRRRLWAADNWALSMIHLLTPSELEDAARALITASKTSLGIEVTMPVIYPDGQAVTVVVTVEGGEYVVHDAGFGAMYLTNAGMRLTKQIRQRLSSLASRYECNFIEGRMSRRCTLDQIAIAIALVANASRLVGDQTLEGHRRADGDFIASVTDSLRDIVGAKRLRTNEGIKGRSGRTYHVRNVILDTQERTFLAFVEALANRASVPNRFMEFHDLKGAYQTTRNFSVYDENEDLPTVDLKLLGEVCEPLTFNQSRKRFRELAA